LHEYPAGQTEQFVEDGGENLPWGQGTGGTFAFLELHSNPAGQGSQVLLEANEVYPLSQTSGNKVVLGHFEPAGQGVQLDELPSE
jgi:hypothetical protein